MTFFRGYIVLLGAVTIACGSTTQQVEPSSTQAQPAAETNTQLANVAPDDTSAAHEATVPRDEAPIDTASTIQEDGYTVCIPEGYARWSRKQAREAAKGLYGLVNEHRTILIGPLEKPVPGEMAKLHELPKQEALEVCSKAFQAQGSDLRVRENATVKVGWGTTCHAVVELGGISDHPMDMAIMRAQGRFFGIMSLAWPRDEVALRGFNDVLQCWRA